MHLKARTFSSVPKYEYRFRFFKLQKIKQATVFFIFNFIRT